jgi:hypothetical protein
MKLRTQLMRELAIGLVLLLLAALLTATIYSILAVQNPLNALPTLQVLYKGEPMPQEYLMLMSYSWRFFFLTKSDVVNPPDAWQNELRAAPVIPDAPLEIVFSYPCQELKISRAADGSNGFVELGGDLRTPVMFGTYTYRIEAFWGVRGSVQYYLKISVV